MFLLYIFEHNSRYSNISFNFQFTVYVQIRTEDFTIMQATWVSTVAGLFNARFSFRSAWLSWSFLQVTFEEKALVINRQSVQHGYKGQSCWQLIFLTDNEQSINHNIAKYWVHCRFGVVQTDLARLLAICWLWLVQRATRLSLSPVRFVSVT